MIENNSPLHLQNYTFILINKGWKGEKGNGDQVFFIFGGSRKKGVPSSRWGRIYSFFAEKEVG